MAHGEETAGDRLRQPDRTSSLQGLDNILEFLCSVSRVASIVLWMANRSAVPGSWSRTQRSGAGFHPPWSTEVGATVPAGGGGGGGSPAETAVFPEVAAGSATGQRRRRCSRHAERVMRWPSVGVRELSRGSDTRPRAS